jgi:hypothetical protein
MEDNSMYLQLSERATLWYHKDIHFSFQDPGPKEIDVESLSQEDKTVLQNAINRRILIKTESDDVPVTNVETDSKTNTSSNDASAKDKELDRILKSAELQLKGSAKTIVVWCKKQGKNVGFRKLESMLTVEKSKLNRKSVIKAVKEALENTGGISLVVDDIEDSEKVEINVV